MNISEIVCISQFMGQISVGQKPCFKTQTLIPANSILGSFTRTWHQESRMTGINYLKNLYNNVASYSHSLEYSSQLYDCCQKIAYGCSNLSQTYKDDLEISAQYQMLGSQFSQLFLSPISTSTRLQELSQLCPVGQNFFSPITNNIKPTPETRLKLIYPFSSSLSSESQI